MCSNCVDYGYLTSHEPTKCPRKAMLHCSHCAVYGHTFETCSKKPDPRLADAVFVEQLLPFHILEKYNITTTTPLPVRWTSEETMPVSPEGEGTPLYVEDLLPSPVREQYAITTQTPIPLKSIPPKERGVIAFVDNKKVIREFLQARGIKPIAGQIYTQMQEYARSQGKRLLKIPRPAVERNAAPKNKREICTEDEEDSEDESDEDEDSEDESDEDEDSEDESDEESDEEESDED
jgi:hypothetical protein